MFTSFVMTVLGADRPGLVESVANVVTAHDANWVESRMAHLAGQFAGIVRIEVPSDQAKALREALQNLSGISISLEEDASEPAMPRQTMTLELIGQDRPGIIREMTRALNLHRINLEELETECISAPMSGERLFRATAVLGIPDQMSLEKLREDLEGIANELTLEVDLIER